MDVTDTRNGHIGWEAENLNDLDDYELEDVKSGSLVCPCGSNEPPIIGQPPAVKRRVFPKSPGLISQSARARKNFIDDLESQAKRQRKGTEAV
jgi:hypothetical protein